MAFHYITPGRCHIPSLLLTVLLCLGAYSIIAATAPPDILSVRTSNVSENSFTVSWDVPTTGNITEYRIMISNGTILTDNTITTLSYTQTGLSPGITYNITIYTVNENGTSSGFLYNVTTLPSTVSDFHVTAVWPTQMNLSWTKPSDTDASNYMYTIVINPGNTNVSTGSSFELVTGLTPGTTYTFTIYTKTQNGVESKASQQTTNTTMPNPVKGLKVTDTSTNSVTLMWESSTDPSVGLYYTVDGGGSNRKTNITTNTTVMTELQPGTDYTFTVYAVTSNEIYSEKSNIVNVTTLPSTVSDFHVTAVWPTQMNLSWTKPNDTHALNYTYTIVINPSSPNVSTSTSFELVTGLTPGTNYTFTIYTETQNRVQSKASQQTTNTTMPSPVMDLNVTDTSNNSVTLVWTSKDPNAGSYTYTVDGGGSIRKTDIGTNTTVMTELQPGTDYNFTVFAVTSNGIYSEKSNIVNVTTLPSPVEKLTVISRSNKSVTLMWNLSSDPNNKSYSYTVDGGGDRKKTNINTNTVEITNLEAGQNYNFTVFAVTWNGRYSKSSNVVNATTQPNIVKGVRKSDVSNATVTLQWEFSKDANNNTYTYNVELWNQGFTSPSSYSLKDNSLTVQNLKPGEDYNLTVFAVTENGIYSQSSNIVSVTTMPNAPKNLQWSAIGVSEVYVNWSAPGDPNDKYYDYNVIWGDTTSGNISTSDTQVTIKDLLPGHLYNITITSVIKTIQSVQARIYTVTMPLSVEKLTVDSISNNSATITWTGPSVVSGYRVTVVDVDGKKTLEKNVTENTCVLDGLTPGTIYNFIVESYAKYPISGSTNRMAAADNSIVSYGTPIIITSETFPDPVTRFECLKLDAYQITVLYDCPKGNYSAFKVLVDNGATINVANCSLDIIIPNLQPAASYKIRVMTVATGTTAVSPQIICSTDNTGVIVGSIFGILLFFLLIALIVFFVKKKRRQKESGENLTPTTFNTRRVHTIPKDKFKQHYETNHSDSDFGFAEEYQELSSVGTTQPKRAAELPENKTKNRFINVLPYDHSRVKLSIMNGISTSDYINANYMPGYNSTKEFIASQGPLPNTTADFWRMIWEHQVNTIVMLTNCMENGRVKCEHYWPLDYTPCTYGDITVTVTSETILSEWTIRDFSIKHANQTGLKYVRHFHFTAWPDHGVPDSTSSIIQFRNLVREYMDQRKSSGPTVVHCSAGVGRTGTLIALDYLMQQIEKEQCIGIYSFVEKMRIHRNLMVQTEEQYIFLNKCMVDLIVEPMDEHIYENHAGSELVYENINAIRNFQRDNV